MSFAAILSATRPASDSPGQLRASLQFAGQTLVEYQARQAARAGASRVMILVNLITPELSQAVDRLNADGVAVTLLRDMVSMIRTAPRDEDALLFGDGAVVAQSWVETIATTDGNALLVTDDSRASAPFDRIDAGQRWGGLVRVTPALLFGTLDMVGDWDLSLTLVRGAVQQGARRVTVPQDDLLEGRVSLVEGQAQADLAAQAAMAAAPRGPSGAGGLEQLALRPAARRLAPPLMRMQVQALHVRIGSQVLGAIALLPIELEWPSAGFALLLLALLLGEVADRLDEIALRAPPGGIIGFVTPMVALAGIALAGGTMLALYAALLLAVLLVAARRGRVGKLPGWQIATPGSALLPMLAATLAGQLPLGVDVVMLMAIASVAVIFLRRPGKSV